MSFDLSISPCIISYTRKAKYASPSRSCFRIAQKGKEIQWLRRSYTVGILGTLPSWAQILLCCGIDTSAVFVGLVRVMSFVCFYTTLFCSIPYSSVHRSWRSVCLRFFEMYTALFAPRIVSIGFCRRRWLSWSPARRTGTFFQAWFFPSAAFWRTGKYFMDWLVFCLLRLAGSFVAGKNGMRDGRGTYVDLCFIYAEYRPKCK